MFILTKGTPNKPKVSARELSLRAEYSKHLYEKPTTKNQRQWNKEIERIIRFELTHKGIKVKLPEKPKRVTKETLKELHRTRGKKILEQSVVNIPKNVQKYFDRVDENGQLTGLDFFEQATGETDLKKYETDLRQALRSVEELSKSPTELPTPEEGYYYSQRPLTADEEDEIADKFPIPEDDEEDDFPEWSVEYINNIKENIDRFDDAYKNIVNDLIDYLIKAVGNNETADMLEKMSQEGFPVEGSMGYSDDNELWLYNWVTRAVNTVPMEEEIRNRIIEYFNEEFLETTIEAYQTRQMTRKTGWNKRTRGWKENE